MPLALGLAAGILAGDGFPSLAGWPGLCVCGTLMFMGWLCRDRHALAAQCCLLLAVVALGATLMSLRLRRDKLPLPSQPATCQAIIISHKTYDKLKGKLYGYSSEIKFTD